MPNIEGTAYRRFLRQEVADRPPLIYAIAAIPKVDLDPAFKPTLSDLFRIMEYMCCGYVIC